MLRKITAKVKGKCYKSVVRPAMVHGAEAWPIKKTEEGRLEVADKDVKVDVWHHEERQAQNLLYPRHSKSSGRILKSP